MSEASPGVAARPFDAEAPILVSGPPGSGKTTIGELVATRLGVPVEDLDASIEAEAGKPVAAIFADDGEAAFRARERAVLLRALARPGRRVITLGGGALVDDASRAEALARSIVVQLRAPAPVLAARLAASHPRPLLAGAEEPAQAIALLLARRRVAYGEGHVVVDATRPPEVVAGDVARAARDRFAWVASRDGGYPVRIARDGALAAGDTTTAAGATSLHLVGDATILPTWGGAVAAALAMAGRPSASVLACPSGEEHKRLSTIERLADGLLAVGADRRALLVAVGGGVTSDVVGLLAALYFRGIPWIAVPTTVLSMVDAAVGGKTAVDLARAKNVVGAFHPPRAVVVDVAHARTEPARQVAAGLAEAVKSALVGDPGLLDVIERDAEAALGADRDVLERIVARALAVKIGIVSRDEHEGGERALLNLGHTFGHALEAASGWGDLLHGEAVAIGLVAALRVGEEMGLTERGLARRTSALLTRLRLPTAAPPERCRAARDLVAADKKRVGAAMRFVAVRAPGRAEVVECPMESLAERLAEAAGRGGG